MNNNNSVHSRRIKLKNYEVLQIDKANQNCSE